MTTPRGIAFFCVSVLCCGGERYSQVDHPRAILRQYFPVEVVLGQHDDGRLGILLGNGVLDDSASEFAQLSNGL